MTGYKHPRKFIATQGPLRETVEDFWRMIWEQKCHVIVMLAKLVEDCRVKCEQYWPDSGSIQIGTLVITLSDVTELSDYIVRRFDVHSVVDSQAANREIRQYHFLGWPDHGVPEHPTSFITFTKFVMNNLPQRPGPIVVHCSAGVGRTGTFIVIDAVLQQVKNEGMLDIYGFVAHVRKQRNFMVQTEAQYVFIYDALLDTVICGNTEISAQDLQLKLRFLNQQNPETGETYLKQEFKRLESGTQDNHLFSIANLPENKQKNRFLNISPYDRNRVILEREHGSRGSDYVNASFIDGYHQRHAYIATQAPLPNTVNDFWRMIWEQECSIIVMLTRLEEKGQERCYEYWPLESSEMYGKLLLDNLAERDYGDFIRRELSITNTESGKTRRIHHFMFIAWPDYGSPTSGSGMIRLLGQVQKSIFIKENKPIVVHCSGGVGRTGVFIALSIGIERLKVEGTIDLFQAVRQLRTQRPAMVQTIDQYLFCYQALKEYLDSFDIYPHITEGETKA